MKKSQIKNVIVNETKNGYVVQLPTGKTKKYKTLAGAEKCAVRETVVLPVPYIVMANTYFWSSQGSASGRRSNEKRHQSDINEFCERVSRIPTVYASGSYIESCRNVYKSMTYQVNLKSTNITGLIGECARWGLTLVK